MLDKKYNSNTISIIGHLTIYIYLNGLTAPFHKTGHLQKGLLCPLNMYGASASHKDFNGKKMNILQGLSLSILVTRGRRAGNEIEGKIKERKETLKDAKYGKKLTPPTTKNRETSFLTEMFIRSIRGCTSREYTLNTSIFKCLFSGGLILKWQMWILICWCIGPDPDSQVYHQNSAIRHRRVKAFREGLNDPLCFGNCSLISYLLLLLWSLWSNYFR